MSESRRTFLWNTGALAASAWLGWPLETAESSARVDVRAHGARGDGRAKDTRAIQQAMDAAAAAGGTVHFPPGDYLSGTLRLRSRTTLHLEAGATLIASPDDADFDGLEALGYDTHADDETSDFAFALLQGRDVKQLRILGPGRIDANRTSRRGPKPIALKLCQRIDIRDLTIANAGNYTISLLGCEEVNIQGVAILNGYSDGIDPDCCRNVRIADCTVESRDDAVCLKASFALGVRRATENVRVSGCRLSTQHNAIKLGTESSGDFRNIAISDCTITGRRHPWKVHMTSGLSLQAVDGGTLEHVAVWNLKMNDVRVPIFVRLARRGRAQQVAIPGSLRDVSISDVLATGALEASSITGIPGHPVERIALEHIRVRTMGGGRPASLDVPEMERRYPDAFMFHGLPGYGLYCRHVAALTVKDIQLTVDLPDARPAVVLDSVDDVDLRALRAAHPIDGGPLLWLHAVRNGHLKDIGSRPEGKTVARISGAATASVRVEHRGTDQLVMVDGDVNAHAVRREAWAPR